MLVRLAQNESPQQYERDERRRDGGEHFQETCVIIRQKLFQRLRLVTVVEALVQLAAVASNQARGEHMILQTLPMDVDGIQLAGAIRLQQ